ncbi:transglycosylase domain-containing protein [Deinococcus sp.]|uniref:transglycosylase domain-containing protein n=1 Tax=Deinococcus sp. TaxID=47478 RepID=UPI0025C31451|nr:transglycosylase domain-containing protein [Deinococcus sp.]
MTWFVRFLKFLSSLVIAALIAGAGIAATYTTKWARELPDYRQLDTLSRNLGAETKVFARDNTFLGSLIPKIGEMNISRTIVSLDEISPFMVGSLISNEDRHFFEHYGLDPNGIARQFQRLAKGEDVQGGSTLTNQLVKNTLLLGEYKMARTPDRKFKEWMLSMQVERSFTKDEILQDYLNAIYWGDGGPVELYGVYSAAQAYFKTTPKRLTLAQSVYLTTLIPSARRYFDYKRVRPMMKAVLNHMVEDKWITQAQADAAWREKLQPAGWQVTYGAHGKVLSAKLVNPKGKELKAVTTNRAPHFMGQVESELVKRFGRDKVYGSGGLRVYTTLSPKVQNAVETASREAYYGYMTSQGQALPPGTTMAAVMLDPYTAEVLGMVGQKLRGNDPPSDWNNAAQGQRQVGSTIKPLLYTTALENGATQLTREYDGPIRIWDRGSQKYYEPQDYEGKMSYRNMTIREGLDKSLNLVAIRVAQFVGLEKFFAKLKLLDIPPNDGTSYAAALGAVETTPVKLAAAYAPFANGGLYRPPRYITRVTDARGQVLYDAANETKLPTRVWSPQVAYLGLDMIRGVVNDLDDTQGGLASRAKFGEWPIGGKTGTTNGVTNGNKDFWMVATTPIYTGAVWVGKQQGGEMSSRYYSGWVNGPIMRRMMEVAHAGIAPTKFAEPAGIYYVPAGEASLPNVTVAMVDRSFLAHNSTQDISSELPQKPQYRETPFEASTSNDPDTVVVSLDRTTGKIATEFTPPSDIVRRRVSIEELPGYAPDQNPAPLKNEQADPSAVKLVRSQAATPAPTAAPSADPASSDHPPQQP